MTDGGEKWKRQLAFDEESIVTGSHMTSCSKSSFSRQEREPLERDCWIIKFSDVPVMCNKYSQKKRSRYEMRNGYKACQISLLNFFVSLLADMTVRNVQWHSYHFTCFCLFVCCCFFLTQIKNVALICSINFWTENKGLRTFKELPT